MQTIKLPFKANDSNKDIINEYRRQQSAVIRWSFNRAKDGLSQKQSRKAAKSLQGIKLMNAWMIQSAIMSG